MKKNLLLSMLTLIALQMFGQTIPTGDFRKEMLTAPGYSMWYRPTSWSTDSFYHQAYVAPYALKKAVNDYSWERVTEWYENKVEVPFSVVYNVYEAEPQTQGPPHNVVGLCANAFNGYTNLTSITFQTPLNHLHDMPFTIGEYAFAGCTSLESIVIPEGADFTGNGHHFEGCTSLKSITLPSTLTNIGEYEFADCSSLEEIVIPEGVKTIADFSTVFKGCSNLKRIVLPSSLQASMDFSVVSSSLEEVKFLTPRNSNRPTYVSFLGCSKLKSIKGLEHLDTSDITDMSYMFCNCSSLTSLDMSKFNTENVTNMFGMFYNCSALTSLDVSKFNTGNVTNIEYMFGSCSSLRSLDVSNFNTSKVTSMYGMFSGCSTLTSLDVSNFNTSNVTNMSAMFSGCSALTSLDVSNFNTSNVEYMSVMFGECSSLKNLNLTNFNTSKVTNMNGMFYYCSALTSLDVNKFNTSKVTDMSYMFFKCSSLKSLDVSNFNTSKVTDMSCMFDFCSSLKSLDVSNFNTSKVTDMNSMFYDCECLTNLDVSNFDTSNVTDMSSMFDTCLSLKSLNSSSFDMNNVTNKRYMFSLVPASNLLYLPKGTTASDFESEADGDLSHESYNIVLTDAGGNSTCEDLRLKDGDDLSIITTPFTAEKVSFDRAFTDGQKSTVYLPFAFDATAFGTVYEFENVNGAGDGITFNAVSGTTTANTPYIIKPNGTAITTENVRVECPVAMEPMGDNEFIGVVEAGYVPNGAFCYDALDGKLKKVVAENGVKISAGRGYFVLPSANYSASAKGMSIAYNDGKTTRIDDALSAKSSERGATMYNLQGQRVGKDYKGVVIVNGKKTFKN